MIPINANNWYTTGGEMDRKLTTFVLVLALVVPGYVRAANIEVPADIGGVSASGTGSVADPYKYDYSSSALDLGADNVYNVDLTSDTTENTLFTNITSLSYDAGGFFIYTNAVPSNRPHLYIYATSNINVRDIDTRTFSTLNYYGGDVYLKAGENITVEDIITEGGNRDAGDVTLTAGDTVTIVSNLNTVGKHPGHVTITASSIVFSGGDLDASAPGSNRNGQDVTLTATNGNISIVGSILADSLQGLGGPVVMNCTGNIVIGSTVDARGKRYDGGSINIVASGSVTISNDVTAAMYSDPRTPSADGGTISITADGAVWLGSDVHTYTIGTNINETYVDDAGNIAITSTADNVTIVGDISAHSRVSANGHLNISAPNGTITLGNLAVTNFNIITLTAGNNGLITTGAIDGLTIAGSTVKGGFKSGTISGSILYNAGMNPSLPSPPYDILDKDTSADTGYKLVSDWSQLFGAATFRFR